MVKTTLYILQLGCWCSCSRCLSCPQGTVWTTQPWPLKGPSYSFTLSLSCIISAFFCSWIYFFIVASFSPTVLTYILPPKNGNYQICTSNLHACQTSLMRFSLLDNPWRRTRQTLQRAKTDCETGCESKCSVLYALSALPWKCCCRREDQDSVIVPK